jgi:hypothetical protein
MTTAVPELDTVKVDAHAAEPVVPVNVQIVKVPLTPVWLRLTLPVGVVAAPSLEVSLTVTLHVEPWLTTIGAVQLTVVEVVLGLTLMLVYL